MDIVNQNKFTVISMQIDIITNKVGFFIFILEKISLVILCFNKV